MSWPSSNAPPAASHLWPKHLQPHLFPSPTVPRTCAETAPCREHSRLSTTRYHRRTPTARTRRRPRANVPRVSTARDAQTCAQLDTAGTNDTADTAFRQQRLKAWQYAAGRCIPIDVGTGRLTARRQAHPNPEDGSPALLHRRRHIRSYRRCSAIC